MTGGLAVSLIAAGLAVVMHVVIFVLESLLFTRPAVRRLFGVRSPPSCKEFPRSSRSVRSCCSDPCRGRFRVEGAGP